MLLVVIYFLVILLIILIFLIFELNTKYKHSLQEQRLAIFSARKINKIILEELEYGNVVQKIADFIPNELQFATGVLAIYDKQSGTLRRIAASRTKEAESAIKALRVPFTKIDISVNDEHNLMSRAIRERSASTTNDVYDVLCPVLTREEAKSIQSIMGTQTTLIYPLFMENEPIGVLVAGTKKNQENLTTYELDTIQAFVDGAAIALQHSILYANMTRATSELKTANEQLKIIDKLKDDSVSLASHELRTPMTAIKSYLWMALNKKGGPLTEKQAYYLTRSYQSTERLINLVNDMLNISRIESGRITLERQPTKIEAVITEVIEEIAPRTQELGITVTIPSSPLPQVFIDVNKIKEVLFNLLGNSLKFTPQGGAITITYSLKDLYVSISVSDTGVGISQDDQSKLFQKFGMVMSSYAGSKQVQGTGLGLYISKKIVELHTGQIVVHSEGTGKGTTFTFTLPIATASDIEENKHHPINPNAMHLGLEHVKV